MITTSVATRKILFEAGCVGTRKILQLRQRRTAGAGPSFCCWRPNFAAGGVCLIPATPAGLFRDSWLSALCPGRHPRHAPPTYGPGRSLLLIIMVGPDPCCTDWVCVDGDRGQTIGPKYVHGPNQLLCVFPQSQSTPPVSSLAAN